MRTGFAADFTIDLGALNEAVISCSNLYVASGPLWYSCFINPQFRVQKVDRELSNHEHDNESHPYHREGDALVLDKPSDPKETARQRREDEQHEFARSQVKTNRTLAWFTGALVLATFCTIGVGVWQAVISRTAAYAARDAVGVASRTLAETVRSNQSQELANKASAQTAIDNFQRDQRPWVLIKYMQIWVTKQDVGSTFGGQIVLTNSGRSPAFDLRVSNAGIQTSPMKLDIDEWARANRKSLLRARATPLAIMAPTDPYIIPYEEQNISKDMADQIHSGKLRVYVFGDVRYFDSFGHEHFTQFCGVYDPKRVEVDFCPTHIHADRDK